MKRGIFVTSGEGMSGATAIKVLEWENIKWLRRWIRVVQGGEFRVSSLRVKNAVLHDPTDDENEDAEEDAAIWKSSLKKPNHQQPFVELLLRELLFRGLLLNSREYSSQEA